MTGSTVVSEGPPPVVEVSVTGVPVATSITLTMVEVDGDWLVDNVGEDGGGEGQVPDVDDIPLPELPELPDLPDLPAPPTGERAAARG